MKIKSFGCSFLYGDELADCSPHTYPAYASNSTWPALLAKSAGYEYECYASCGIGNMQIADIILNHLVNDTESLYIIQWTSEARFDIKESLQSWDTMLPADVTEKSTRYYQNYYSSYTNTLATLMYINSTINLLNEKNVRYIMSYSYDTIFDCKSPATDLLASYITPHLISFENHGMFDWAYIKNYPAGSRKHPLEEAHLAAADYIKTNLPNRLGITL